MPEHPELDDVAPEEERDRPVDDDTKPSLGERQLVEVIAPRHEPTGEAAQAQAHHVGDALVAAERRDLAQHAVVVRLRSACDVLREAPRLTQRMLAGRRVRIRAARVRDAGAVPERPDAVEAANAQELVDLDAAALVEGQAELAEERIRAHAGRPDERVRRYPGAV